MSKLAYGFGFALGTLTRQFLYAVKKTSSAPTAIHPKAVPLLPPPCVPDRLVREMDHLPALARKGVDLNHWYAANTRVVEKPARRSRKKPIARSLTSATC
ncbi:hypothetical protein FIV41_32015 [Pseudomonas marginalis]|uniref:Uncharacterized protein n=1 Tax=Pseudomonas marginalis TaxID=298 RepID=A0A9X9BK72_PSEMA|nr:hypothetical protein [Pseudomonas marginalis]TWR48091.1 hypothetical protein FIV41_32015 [Pseudomonas marginalis]SEB32997.1 hypothetical protein SAMN04490193_0217 [Pseudomonas marginalis]